MTALLAITCALLVVSAGLKVRSGLRVGLGIDVLTIAELLFGGVVGFAALGSAAGGATPLIAWMAPAGVFVVLASTASFGLKLKAFRERREALQAERLETYVKYFHKADDGPDEGA